MMAGNPNWWSMNNMRPPSSQQSSSAFLSPPTLFSPRYVPESSSSLPFNSLADTPDLPHSWSQLLLVGSSGEEDRFGSSDFQAKNVEWEDQILNPSQRIPAVDVKQEVVSQSSHPYNHGDEGFQTSRPPWSQIMPVSSPSTETGGACKKARVQPSPSQPPLKVRKEKLGDRITALHQLVSPFGKTDTASVLLEAIGYIRFLQGQIEALSSPYLGNASGNMRNQQCVQGEMNCIFPKDPGQLLNDNCLKRKGSAPNQQDTQDAPKDLKSRGLCLVPVSCTQQVGSDNGADYWSPALGGGF
ncbi:Transcription factor bHLH68 [Vitis vinifera]|uniref:Transcription factor bHLH68 n=1 Tax=Vitis vinifera TaxID=29760 RepID=A0A438GKX2_VITVI|nr:Transcription factor bHLH68 [Vitis vinifera]